MGIGRSAALEEVDEARDRVRARALHDSNGAIVGEGKGVISSMAAICGEEMAEPGDTEPAVECSHERTLGMRWVKLAAEALDAIRGSTSMDATDDLRLRLCRSVLMCSSCIMFVVSLVGGEACEYMDASAFCLNASRFRLR